MTTTITERIGGTPTVAAASTDLAALEDLSGTGVPERTGANAWSLRALTGANNALSPEIADALSLGTATLPWRRSGCEARSGDDECDRTA